MLKASEVITILAMADGLELEKRGDMGFLRTAGHREFIAIPLSGLEHIPSESNVRELAKESDIIDILKSPLGNSALGRHYGVTKECISNIRRRKTWAHVNPDN